MKILEYTRTFVVALLVVSATSFIFDDPDQRKELNERRVSALHTAKMRMSKALENGKTDPRRLIEICIGIPGVVCESNGDIITISFFPDGSLRKLYESEKWQVTNGHWLEYVGLVE